MMRGTRTEAVCRRLLHPETFQLIMSPALADLQFESRRDPHRLALGYGGALRAFGGALLYDAARDLRLSIGNPEWRASRREDASTFAGLVLVQAVYYLALLGIATGTLDRTDLTSGFLFKQPLTLILVLAATLVLPVITVAICFWSGGRPARQ